MKLLINYDFELSKAVSMALKELANRLDKATSQKLSDDITQFSVAWQGDNAAEYTVKHKALMKQYKRTCNDIYKQGEELDKLSKRLFLEEQKVKEIAEKREYGVE